MHTLILLVIVSVMNACTNSQSLTQVSEIFSDEQSQSLLHADIVLLGEQHDNPQHHQIQAEIVEWLGRSGRLGSVVFEQLTWQQQDITSRLSSRNLPQLPEALNWKTSGWPDFGFYQPIFAAGLRYRATIIAGNITPQQSKAVYKDGPTVVFSQDEQQRLGLTQDLGSDAVKNLRQEIFEGHCQMIPQDHVSAMIPIQRSRDAAMALAWSRQTKTGTSVFIVGSGHARKDFGIPWYLHQLQPGLKIWSIGMTEDNTNKLSPYYDQVIVTPPVPRDNPCAELKKKLEQPATRP